MFTSSATDLGLQRPLAPVMMNTQHDHKKVLPVRVAQMQQGKKNYAFWFWLTESLGMRHMGLQLKCTVYNAIIDGHSQSWWSRQLEGDTTLSILLQTWMQTEKNYRSHTTRGETIYHYISTYWTLHVYMCEAHVGVNGAPFHVQVCLQTIIGELLLLCGVTLSQSLEACMMSVPHLLVDCQCNLNASCECQLSWAWSTYEPI